MLKFEHFWKCTPEMYPNHIFKSSQVAFNKKVANTIVQKKELAVNPLSAQCWVSFKLNQTIVLQKKIMIQVTFIFFVLITLYTEKN